MSNVFQLRSLYYVTQHVNSKTVATFPLSIIHGKMQFCELLYFFLICLAIKGINLNTTDVILTTHQMIKTDHNSEEKIPIRATRIKLKSNLDPENLC